MTRDRAAVRRVARGHSRRTGLRENTRRRTRTETVEHATEFAGKPAGYGKQMYQKYNSENYHQPSDEFREDWDFSGFPVLIRFALDLGREMANAERLPTWAPGDEFRPAREKSGVR